MLGFRYETQFGESLRSKRVHEPIVQIDVAPD